MKPVQLDFSEVEERALRMSREALVHAIADCYKTARYAREIELSGNPVIKSEGYYMDELSVYRRELKKRG